MDNKLEIMLYRQIKEGDEDSFEILFRHYYPILCTYANSFVKLPDISEEIVHEIFVTIWEKRDSLSIDTSVKAYLFRCVHNNSIKFLKNRLQTDKKKKSIKDEILKMHELNVNNLDSKIVDKMISEEFDIEFNKALDSLPDQCREVFRLCRYENLSYAEVAGKMDISVNSVKTQMKRALVKLRICLDKNL